MSSQELPRPALSRRALVRGAGLVGGAIAAQQWSPNSLIASTRAATRLSVLGPLPPDPAPPGVAQFAEDRFEEWKTAHDTRVTYQSVRWPDLRDTIASGFDAEDGGADLLYLNGWVPDFFESLTPLSDTLMSTLRTDLPLSAMTSGSWNGSTFAVPYTLSLLMLYYNQDLFAEAGLPSPPTTWGELKEYAAALTNGQDGFGWVCNYGAPSGVGSAASYWMAFLQQAGGTMYGPDGLPIFNDQPGVEALQVMVDLMPSTVPESPSMLGIIDATTALKQGRAAMMMNWPFMWQEIQDPATTSFPGGIATAVLPAGPAAIASIDASDAWGISALSGDPEMAEALIAFYLDPAVQKEQVLATGWLSPRPSVLADPEVQRVAPHAATLLKQAGYPYNSFFTPDYDAITGAISAEIQRALVGEKSAADAIQDASEAVTAIVRARMAE